MAREEITPSEWLIMEVLWECGAPLTSSEVIKRMQGNVDMSARMVRVLMNRLNQKGVLGYTVDESDARVYHYFVLKSKQECLKEKGRRFVDSYFSGSRTNAVAALLENVTLTDEQIAELKRVLEQSREKAIGFLVGQTMKAMKGKADPASVNKLLKELL